MTISSVSVTHQCLVDRTNWCKVDIYLDVDKDVLSLCDWNCVLETFMYMGPIIYILAEKEEEEILRL